MYDYVFSGRATKPVISQPYVPSVSTGSHKEEVNQYTSVGC